MNVAYRKIESDKRKATYRAIRTHRIAYIILAVSVIFFAFSFSLSLSDELVLEAACNNISAMAIAA